jgi:hypothetical protein
MKRILLSVALIAAMTAPALARQSKTDSGLAKLAPSDRFQQVCDIALMEKLRHENRSYKLEDTVPKSEWDAHGLSIH